MPAANRFDSRKTLVKGQIGETVSSFGTTDDHTLYEVGNLIKERIANWLMDSDHPERSNYKLHVLDGSVNVLPSFVLEHKVYGTSMKVPDVWDLDVEVVKEGRLLHITVKL